MKQGEDGLECISCGLTLDPVVEEGVEVVVADPKNRWLRPSLIAGGVIFLVGFLTLIIAYAPSNGAGANALSKSAMVAVIEDYILNDDAQLVGDTIQRPRTTEVANLVDTIGCQAVPADTETSIRWMSMLGTTVNTLRPAIPENWGLDSACPTESGGAYLLTHLNDGVAISEVSATGDLVWSQLLPARGELPDGAKMNVTARDIVVLLPRLDVAAMRVVSFDFNGAEKWRETIYVTASVERSHMTQNGLGDFVQAWTELDRATRLAVISPAGVLVQNTEIAEPNLILRGVAGDDLGQTLLVFDDAGVSAQLVSASGVVGQRWRINSGMTPIGVVRHDEVFLVFALSPTRLSIWGINEYGATSSPIELNVSNQLIDGEIKQINSFEAIASLRADNEIITDVTLDLRRISNGLVFDSSDSGSTAINVLGSDMASDIPVAPLSSAADVPSTAAVETVGNSDLGSVAESELVEPEDDTLPSPQAETNSSSLSDAARVEALPSVAAPTLSENEVRCTFSCQTIDEPVAEYVLSQIVEKAADESLQDVRVRLNETHENLCSLSGGEPVESYLRVCRN
ncbi:MAG: hypothetical protein HRT81_15815 [Henriciella sp.]|nr:hypothetical protein [Henriciella sp.]